MKSGKIDGIVYVDSNKFRLGSTMASAGAILTFVGLFIQYRNGTDIFKGSDHKAQESIRQLYDVMKGRVTK